MLAARHAVNTLSLFMKMNRSPAIAFLSGFHAPVWYFDPFLGIGGVASVSCSTVITLATVLGVFFYTGRRYGQRRAARCRAAAAEL